MLTASKRPAGSGNTKTAAALIATYSENSKKFRQTLEDLKTNTFTLGYQGSTFGNSENFNIVERFRIEAFFTELDHLFLCFDNFKESGKITICYVEAILSLFIENRKVVGSRFSDKKLLDEVFAITEFWKGLSEVETYYEEVIGCLNLHEWLDNLLSFVKPVSEQKRAA